MLIYLSATSFQTELKASPTLGLAMNPHEVLGVGSDATRDQINKAYFDKVAKHHPNNGGDAWAFQQVQKAYEELTGFNDSESAIASPTSNDIPTASPLLPPMAVITDDEQPAGEVGQPAPVPMAVPLRSPAVMESDSAPEEYVVAPSIKSVDPTGTNIESSGRPKTKRHQRKKESRSGLWQVFGVIGGGLSAIVVSYFILQYMGYFDALQAQGDEENRSEQVDSEQTKGRRSPNRNNSSSSNKSNSRQPNSKSNNSDRAIPNSDGLLGDDVPVNMKQKSRRKKKNNKNENISSPTMMDGENEVSSNSPRSDSSEGEFSNAPFWPAIANSIAKYKATFGEPIDAKREEAKTEWLKEFKDEFEGKKHTFYFRIANFDRIQRGAYTVRFDSLKNGFTADQRSKMKFSRELKLKLTDSRAKELVQGDVVEISGIVKTGLDTRLNALLTQNRYLPVFQYIDGRANITVALSRYKVKYLSKDVESEQPTKDSPVKESPDKNDGESATSDS